MEGKLLKQEFFNIRIVNRFAIVSKEYFEGSDTYNIRFINNKESDFINSYESFGFIVELKDDITNFKIFGTLTFLEAENIWAQIQNFESLIASCEITL
ncbi:hypothetical protein IU405_03020 [Polaribacter sp. BAL334]|uniref:hypothetical protein n=1 Tax=Polaribacter sp. BAL334 TaxID=1708178 RepID=UPI0018D20D1A|nr:hypothetical protein [Polaribacter sp. BAL334]MBG7611211.1 hypothetical protein [Polaribacter sp. BAL334]